MAEFCRRFSLWIFSNSNSFRAEYPLQYFWITTTALRFLAKLFTARRRLTIDWTTTMSARIFPYFFFSTNRFQFFWMITADRCLNISRSCNIFLYSFLARNARQNFWRQMAPFFFFEKSETANRRRINDCTMMTEFRVETNFLRATVALQFFCITMADSNLSFSLANKEALKFRLTTKPLQNFCMQTAACLCFRKWFWARYALTRDWILTILDLVTSNCFWTIKAFQFFWRVTAAALRIFSLSWRIARWVLRARMPFQIFWMLIAERIRSQAILASLFRQMVWIIVAARCSWRRRSTRFEAKSLKLKPFLMNAWIYVFPNPNHIETLNDILPTSSAYSDQI